LDPEGGLVVGTDTGGETTVVAGDVLSPREGWSAA